MRKSFHILNDKRLRNYFNMTISYRYNSDVLVKYFDFIPLNTEDTTFTLPSHRNRKTAVWVVSHCKTPSHREQFVNELQKYINITIIGDCGRRIGSFCPHFAHNCLNNIVKDYKFVITFENTLCEEYLTEKAAQFMSLPTIPIVMSYGNTGLLPKRSFINVFDFKSISSLAEYLMYLAKKESSYNEYFQWKRRWRVVDHLTTRPQVICDICDKLHSGFHRSYTNLADWFAHPGACREKGLRELFSDF